jgi:hypothetical protein
MLVAQPPSNVKLNNKGARADLIEIAVVVGVTVCMTASNSSTRVDRVPQGSLVAHQTRDWAKVPAFITLTFACVSPINYN